MLFGLLLMSCDALSNTNESNNKVVTFSLDKINETSFTVTINNAR